MIFIVEFKGKEIKTISKIRFIFLNNGSTLAGHEKMAKYRLEFFQKGV